MESLNTQLVQSWEFPRLKWVAAGTNLELWYTCMYLPCGTMQPRGAQLYFLKLFYFAVFVPRGEGRGCGKPGTYPTNTGVASLPKGKFKMPSAVIRGLFIPRTELSKVSLYCSKPKLCHTGMGVWVKVRQRQGRSCELSFCANVSKDVD